MLTRSVVVKSMASAMSPRQPRLIDYGPQLVGLFVFVLALWAQVGDAFVGRFMGDGLNLVLAKALARGDGMLLIHFPDAVPARWIHPLYPFVISLVGKVWPTFPDNLVLIQILDSAFLGVAAWIVSLHVRRLDFSPLYALTAVALGFSSASILSLSVSAFAEPLLLVLAAGAVLLADRKGLSRWTAAASGLLAGASMLTGNIGVFVVVGVVTAFALQKRVGFAVVAAVVATIVVIPWLAWTIRVADPTGLAAVAVESARQAGELDGVISWQGLGPLVNLLLPSLPRWMMFVAGPIAAGFFGVGLLSVFRTAPALVIVVSTCIMGAWLHPAVVPRNEWILFPWFVVLLAIGASRSWGYARQTRIPVFLAFVVLSVAYVPRTAVSVASRQYAASLVGQNDFLRRLFLSINVELPEDAVIASDAEAMVHLYTGRLVIPARSDFSRTYCNAGVTHVARTNLPVPGAIDDELIRAMGSSVSTVFSLTDGPSLYHFTCPR